jgi:multiple sugar transport system permease protein
MKKNNIIKFFSEDNKQGYIFLIPGILYILILSAYPLIYSLILSFTSWDIRDPNSSMIFAGLSNYFDMIKDHQFLSSLRVTLSFLALSLLLEIPLGMGIAILITNDRINNILRNIFRSLLVLTIVMVPIVTGTLWRTILTNRYGPLDYFLSFIGLSGIRWLSNSNMAFFSIVLVETWQQTTVVVLIFMGGLLGLPKEQIEAANIDGCSSIGIFRYIIIPLLKPLFIIVLLLRSMDLIKVFDFIYGMTGGGPGYATEVLNLFIYREGIQFLNLNGAAAASWIVLLFLLPITIIFTLRFFFPKND